MDRDLNYLDRESWSAERLSRKALSEFSHPFLRQYEVAPSRKTNRVRCAWSKSYRRVASLIERNHLPTDYFMVASAYAETRRGIARTLGLGCKAGNGNARGSRCSHFRMSPGSNLGTIRRQLVRRPFSGKVVASPRDRRSCRASGYRGSAVPPTSRHCGVGRPLQVRKSWQCVSKNEDGHRLFRRFWWKAARPLSGLPMKYAAVCS